MLSARAEHALNRGTTCGVVGLAVGGFAMSYDALHSLALAQGVPGALAWLWPLVVDGFIVVASLSVVRAIADGRRAVYPWLLVLAFSSISVAFNVVHAAPTLVARLVAAIPPAALVLSFELLMRQLRAALGPKPTTTEPAIAPATSSLAPSLESLSTSETRTTTRRRVTSSPSPLLEQAREIYAARDSERVTGTTLARELGISDGYGRRLLRQLAAEVGGAA